jgi:phenylpyruvate tautomerase PptA (4-oxalocrotonate tautomerase family)
VSEGRKHDLSRLTPELRAALVAELTSLISRAATLTPDEIVVLLHLLAYAGFSGEGVLFVPELSALWGGADSYIPKAHLPPDRARAAVKILRRRGVLKDAEHGASVVDNSVLRALAEAPR